jgi:hypothetical protein
MSLDTFVPEIVDRGTFKRRCEPGADRPEKSINPDCPCDYSEFARGTKKAHVKQDNGRFDEENRNGIASLNDPYRLYQKLISAHFHIFSSK